jgi:hypothetical protein
VFLVFDIETAFLYPWALRYRELSCAGALDGGICSAGISFFGLGEVVVFMAILIVALAYVWRKRAVGTLPAATSSCPRRVVPKGQGTTPHVSQSARSNCQSVQGTQSRISSVTRHHIARASRSRRSAVSASRAKAA